jgi:hypothetical protein
MTAATGGSTNLADVIVSSSAGVAFTNSVRGFHFWFLEQETGTSAQIQAAQTNNHDRHWFVCQLDTLTPYWCGYAPDAANSNNPNGTLGGYFL